MLNRVYKLSDKPYAGDIISENIFRRRDKIYWNIKNFWAQTQNNGVFAENILRLVLDGVNLNHLSKNHPHVDIAVINSIPGFCEQNEIISVKSSIYRDPSLAKLISDTKSIKLFSMFSYVMFASSDYELNYEKDFVGSKELLQDGIRILSGLENKDWKALVNITMFYLMKKNKENLINNYYEDIAKLGNMPVSQANDYDLYFGKYNSSYRIPVLRRLVELDAPISLGGIHLKEDGNKIVCCIHKTNSIKLNKYWEKLVDTWLDKDFFSKEDVKYLRLSEIKQIFDITDAGFPINIDIELDDSWSPETEDFSNKSEREKIAIAKERANRRTSKLYVATKFKDADFRGQEDEVNKFFIKSIDLIERNPQIITKFIQFANSIDSGSSQSS